MKKSIKPRIKIWFLEMTVLPPPSSVSNWPKIANFEKGYIYGNSLRDALIRKFSIWYTYVIRKNNIEIRTVGGRRIIAFYKMRPI